MKKSKITFLKEKQIEKKAEQNYAFEENNYAQNPIETKFRAFQKTKKDINLNDLFD